MAPFISLANVAELYLGVGRDDGELSEVGKDLRLGVIHLGLGGWAAVFAQTLY